jgi:saccharopine dehydrogenase-like NADP-dependent oxidoreductase
VSPTEAPDISPIEARKILILGGTGRVGSSVAASLLQLTPGHKVTLAGRSQANFDKAVARRPDLSSSVFTAVDIADKESVALAAASHDLVIHTAGPFQRRQDLSVLEACIAVGTPYLDVCDDQEHSVLTKSLHDAAVKAGVPCITTGGIYPGVSNVMAAHMCSLARKEYNLEDLSYRNPLPGAYFGCSSTVVMPLAQDLCARIHHAFWVI